MSRFTPVTVGLPPEVADLLTRAAATSRLTRSELVRRIVVTALLEDADDGVDIEVHPTHLTSHATGYRHHVLVELDIVADDACEAEKNRVGQRNAAVLNLQCPCGGPLTLLEDPGGTRPSIDAHPSMRGAVVVPSISQPGSKRVTVRAVMSHRPTCPASAVKAHS